MSALISPFPLQWPDNLPRHKGLREGGQFRTTLGGALENARKSLIAFGRDTGITIKEADVVFSSNYGGAGLMQSQKFPDDPGVALWFEWDGAMRCIAVDRYGKIEANLQAIHHILEADRTKLRHGSLAIVRAAYKGFVALPAPAGSHWSDVLGIKRSASRDEIEAAYRTKAKAAHPDVAGGSTEAMANLNAARTAALAERAP